MSAIVIVGAGTVAKVGWTALRRSNRTSDSTGARGASTATEASGHPIQTLSLVPSGPSPEDLAIAELVQFEPLIAFDATRAVEVALNPDLSRVLNSLSSIVRGAASNAPAALANAGGKLYELRFMPEITRQIADGTLTLQKAIDGGYRSGAVGPNGRYAAQGRLVEAGHAGRKLATVAAAAFQVLSFVVGQEHLSQINAKLERISEAVDSLRRERQLEREGEILACLRGLQEDVELLLHGELDEAARAKVVDRLRDVDQLFDRLTHLIDASLSGIANNLRGASLRKGMLQGLDQTSASLAIKIDEIATWRRLDVLSTNLLAYAAQVSLALPMRDPYVHKRMERLQARLNQPDIDFRAFVAMRIETDLKSFFSTPAQRRSRRNHAWIHVRESENQFGIARDRLIVRHAEIEDALARKATQADEGLRLVVEVDDDGGVRRLYRPEPESASAANSGQNDSDAANARAAE
ncbi:hypothetical protein DF164_34615 [Burkholderia stagnalis]|nr:hypothetical protein DF164_34615 [Burkholderia stagnalis]RQY31839.1 hypothetical protein DF113_32590 [Burkholderia stagnalis]RQY71525.1 hypothetical protein DF110_10405 [Burkholderia stagnalis]